MNTLVVNFFAGPGAGKSTMSAALFAELKSRGILCELVTEYAKDKVWEESFGVFNDQIYIFGKQNHRIRKLLGKVAVVITDSPVLLSLFYGPGESDEFKALVLWEFSSTRSFNVFLNRVKKYEPAGRMQTETEAIEVDSKIRNVLDECNIPYTTIDGKVGNVTALADRIVKFL